MISMKQAHPISVQGGGILLSYETMEIFNLIGENRWTAVFIADHANTRFAGFAAASALVNCILLKIVYLKQKITKPNTTQHKSKQLNIIDCINIVNCTKHNLNVLSMCQFTR